MALPFSRPAAAGCRATPSTTAAPRLPLPCAAPIAPPARTTPPPMNAPALIRPASVIMLAGGLGRPAVHTRADVAAAAIAVAEAGGFTALTTRRVAAELGTGAASLYRYVRNRGELLELVTDH